MYLFFFCVYLLGSGCGSGSIWTFLGSRIRIRKKTYADPKHCKKQVFLLVPCSLWVVVEWVTAPASPPLSLASPSPPRSRLRPSAPVAAPLLHPQRWGGWGARRRWQWGQCCRSVAVFPTPRLPPVWQVPCTKNEQLEQQIYFYYSPEFKKVQNSAHFCVNNEFVLML